MARYARQTVADIPYHIINRGNNHQAIFFGKDNYEFFLESIELAKGKYPCKIYSFILMPNHIHLLLEPVGEGQNLALFMKHISQKHGQYINKYYSRTGTLWEGRYKSSAVSTDHYLLTCSRYIEMNCVRAGIVKRPEEYAFSSYRAKAGLKKIKWLDYDPVYLDLGKTEEERHKKYRNWIHEIVLKGEWDMVRESIQRNWAYGDEQFKEKMENVLGRKFEIKTSGRRPKRGSKI
jgi:putative transposase